MRAIFFSLFFFLSSFALADESPFFGPVAIRDQYEINALHLNSTARSAEVLLEGSLESAVNFSWTNAYASRDPYRVDLERREVSLDLQYGLNEELTIGTFIPVIWRGGGVLDGFIDSWHDFFGLPEGGRDQVPKDEYVVTGLTNGGNGFSLDDDGFGLGNLELFTRYQLLRERDSGVNLLTDFHLSLPTAKDEFGHDGVDLSLGLVVSKGWDPVELTFGSTYLYYSDDEEQGLKYENHHVELFGWGEILLSETVALQLGLLWSNMTVNNIQDHPHHRLYLDTGLTIRLGESDLLDIIVRENPSASRGTADVSFIFGWRSTWG